MSSFEQSDCCTAPFALLRSLFDAAVAAARADVCVPAHLPPPRGRLIVIGAGKAAAAMAQAVEANWPGPLQGLVVTRSGYEAPLQRIELVSASHPHPDAVAMAAAQRMLALVGEAGADDQILCLLSGGGSALLPLPAPGVTLADKQALGAALLAAGADIGEINCVRRHLSAIKGGRLAAACSQTPLLTLAISDVAGDDPVNIASGPTCADPTSCADALAVLRRYDVDAPPAVLQLLRSGAGESLKPGDARLQHASLRLVATPRAALLQAAQAARAAGLQVCLLGDAIEGESRQVAAAFAAIARSAARYGDPCAAPCVLLSGGETTVRLRGDGCGGPNAEFLLALALRLQGEAGVYALAADSDGVDGGADIAGACIGPDTLQRAAALGLDARAALDNNDAHGFFSALGDAVVCGPTLTNVNDFRAILVLPGQ